MGWGGPVGSSRLIPKTQIPRVRYRPTKEYGSEYVTGDGQERKRGSLKPTEIRSRIYRETPSHEEEPRGYPT